MNRFQRLQKEVRGLRAWAEPIPKELITELEKERRKYELLEKEKHDLDLVLRAWRTASSSTARDRHLKFLTELYRVATKWERSTRCGWISKIIQRKYGLTQRVGGLHDLLLRLPVYGSNVDRRIRHRWHCIIRLCRAFDVQPDKLVDLVRRCGGINAAARRWHDIRQLHPRRKTHSRPHRQG